MEYFPISDAQLDEEAEKAGWRAAERFGFAVPLPAGTRLSQPARLDRCRARTDAAMAAIGDIQQWLVDDDREVRELARGGMNKLMYSAYAGDQNETAIGRSETLRGLDRLVFQLLSRNLNTDAPGPWWQEIRWQRRVRKMMVWAALGFAAAAGALLAFGFNLWAIPCALAAGAIDLLDGAFARAVQMRDARLRWRSCISSHAGDMLMLGGIAVGQNVLGDIATSTLAPLLAFTMLLSMFGSFTRTSALQAGYRLWRSPSERWVRYGSIVSFAVLAAFGHAALGVVTVVAGLSLFAFAEILRVALRVEQMPQMVGGGVVFASDTRQVHAWGLSDEWENTWNIDEADERMDRKLNESSAEANR